MIRRWAYVNIVKVLPTSRPSLLWLSILFQKAKEAKAPRKIPLYPARDATITSIIKQMALII